jgi:hypothetical protein
MKTRRLLLAAMLVWTIAACDGVANDTTARRGLTPGPVRLEAEGDMPSLDGAIAWLKSPPLSTAELRGKVVVVEFWTYTCVNWRRTLPYVRAWANRYRNRSAESSGGYRAWDRSRMALRSSRADSSMAESETRCLPRFATTKRSWRCTALGWVEVAVQRTGERQSLIFENRDIKALADASGFA